MDAFHTLYDLRRRHDPAAIEDLLTDEDYRRINQQAWARASGEIHAAFNAHRDALLAERQAASTPNYVIRPAGWRPTWAH